jgi:hypothetical protein
MYRKKGLKQSVVIILVILLLIILTSCGRARMRDNSEILEQPENTESETDAQQPKINIDNILFWDNFQDGDTKGWEILSGWDTQQDGDEYWFQSINTSGAWVPKGLEWTDDYALRAVYNVQEGTLGFSFYATNNGRYLVLIQQDRMSLIKEEGDEKTVLAQCDAPSYNKLHMITIGIKDKKIQAYIDKELMLGFEDPDPLSGGTIALGTAENSTCLVDNILVNKILKNLPNLDPVSKQYVGDEIIFPEYTGEEVAELPEDSSEFEDLPEDNVPDQIASPLISFTVENSERISIDSGQDVSVEWQVENASLVLYQSQVVDSSGSVVESPQETTEYILTVTDLVGNIEVYTVTVEVIDDSENNGGNAAGVDISVKGIGHEKPYIKGEPIDVNVTIKNRGDVDSGAFSVVWYPNSDGVVGLSWNVGSLGSGEEKSLSGSYSGYPNVGDYTWKVIADSENETNDVDISNNDRSGDLHVNPGNAESPDMVLKGVGIDGPIIKGEPVNVRVTIKNVGDLGASGFKVEWFADGHGSAALSWDILILAPGVELTLDGVYSGYPQSGEFTWTAKVDKAAQIEDSNRGNNSTSGPVNVRDE